MQTAMNDYQFTVTSESSCKQINYYDVTIRRDDVIATARIVEQHDSYCMISLQFEGMKGLNVIHQFTSGLVGREAEILGAVVRRYNECLITVSA